MLLNGIYLSVVVLLFSNCATIRIPEAISYDENDLNILRQNSFNISAIDIGDDRSAFLQWLAGLLGLIAPTTQKPVTLIPPEKCGECKCGITNTMHRIVGGIETQVNEYPWMVALMYSGQFYCGASVINDRYLLTAAHCVSGFTKGRISATILLHNISTEPQKRIITRKAERIVIHEHFASSNYDNDIALVEMDKILTFDDLLRPVCLPTPGRSYTGFDGIATGWGATQQHGDISNTLQEVIVPIQSNDDCRKTGYGQKRITDNMLCAGLKEGMKDSCQGDSGGPLHVKNDTFCQLAGIVSWGEGCAKPNYPGVYTRVNRYYTWIKSNTRNACYC